MSNDGWAVQDTVSGVHVFPEEDTVVHVFSPDCPCLPTRTEHGYSDLNTYKIGVRYMYTHNALGG